MKATIKQKMEARMNQQNLKAGPVLCVCLQGFVHALLSLAVGFIVLPQGIYHFLAVQLRCSDKQSHKALCAGSRFGEDPPLYSARKDGLAVTN